MPTVFSAEINWDRPFKVERSYQTARHVGQDGTEQRMAKRRVPRERWSFAVSALEPRDAARLAALLTAGQNEDWAVPYWPHATPVSADAAAGSSVALLTLAGTSSRRFAVGGYAILWTDPHTTELCVVSAVGATSVTVLTLAASVVAGARLVPAALGSWSQDLDVRMPNRATSDVEVAFTIRPGTDPTVSDASGTAVFSVSRENRAEAASMRMAPSLDTLDNLTYDHADFARAALPDRSREASFLLDGRAEVKALEDWFDGVRGSWKSFYWPTGQYDMTPTATTSTSMTILSIGYTARLFPIAARRMLAFTGWDGASVLRTVTASIDNGDGTETLALSAAPPGSYAAVSLALLMRVADDTITYSWLSSLVAEATVPMTEVA
jgi:hypothetical protein